MPVAMARNILAIRYITFTHGTTLDHEAVVVLAMGKIQIEDACQMDGFGSRRSTMGAIWRDHIVVAFPDLRECTRSVPDKHERIAEYFSCP